MSKAVLISSLIVLNAMLAPVSGLPQTKHVPRDPAGISQLVENRDGRVSCWGVRIQLGKLRFGHNISPNQIIIREAKHGHDLKEMVTWSVEQNAKQLVIRFKPGMGDFGSGNAVEVQIDSSAFIGRTSSGSQHYLWSRACSLARKSPATRHKHSRFISKVFLDSQENVHIVYNDGRDERPPKEVGQVSCSSPSITKDRQTAGWLVNYDNHGITSYPISLTLIIYQKGRVIRKLGNGMSFGNWYFSKDSKRVAFYTNTVHGSLAPYYELHDIKTNRVVDKWQGPLTDKSPAWTKRLSKY